MVEETREKLTRERWLRESLEILARKGSAGLSLNRLIEHFHVTKGSFYWHFESLADFHHSLVDYWHEQFTASVPRIVERTSDDAPGRLRFLLEFVAEKELARYDTVISTLAARHPPLQEKVAASYAFRLKYVRKQFAAMGFRGNQATMHARVFVAYSAAEPMVNASLTKEQRLKQIREIWRILVPAIDTST